MTCQQNLDYNHCVNINYGGGVLYNNVVYTWVH